jgi:hypothetical protein
MLAGRKKPVKKTLLLLVLTVLWPITAHASLIFYDISFTVSGQNLADPLFGDIQVEVYFPQDTEGDPFQQNTNGLPAPQ